MASAKYSQAVKQPIMVRYIRFSNKLCWMTAIAHTQIPVRKMKEINLEQKRPGLLMVDSWMLISSLSSQWKRCLSILLEIQSKKEGCLGMMLLFILKQFIYRLYYRSLDHHGSHIPHLRGRVSGEVFLDIRGHFDVGSEALALVHYLHSRFGVDDEDLLQRHSSVQISHCIVFAIPQTCHEGRGREEAIEEIHHVCLDAARLLSQLLGKGWHKLLGLHEDRPIDSNGESQVVFGIIVKRERSHGQPYNFIPIFIDGLGEIGISFMQVISINKIIEMSSDVVLGDCPIDIAHHQLIIASVEVDLCLHLELSQRVDGLIHAKYQMQLSNFLIAQNLRVDIALVVQGKFDVTDEDVVDGYFNGRAVVGGAIGPKTYQKGSALVLPILLLDDNGVADSCQYRVILERTGDYLSGLEARTEQVHKQRIIAFRNGQ